ncbi:uncharacterized protein LOC141997654 [Natator depressus]|uniref:uncharacterized protein LOC141997654 n=1 Tax=Natator depressus TaxID=27790 RepID=UPI003EBFBBCE
MLMTISIAFGSWDLAVGEAASFPSQVNLGHCCCWFIELNMAQRQCQNFLRGKTSSAEFIPGDFMNPSWQHAGKYTLVAMQLICIHHTRVREAAVSTWRRCALDSKAAANVSSLPPPSQRLSQIRWRKKRTCNDMFSEPMQSSSTDRAVWRDTIAEYRTVADEREERWWQEDQRRHEATLGLLRDQTDMLQRPVEVHEWQQDHRLPLQPLLNRPPSSLSSIASPPRHPRTWGGRIQAPNHSSPVDSTSNRRLALNTF